MEPLLLALVAALSVFVGLLIGGVGIGGVLLVPMLTYVLGLEVYQAISAAMLSYLFSGAVGAWAYARRKTIQWSAAAWLFLGAAAGAFLGATAAASVSSLALEVFIAVLIVLAGINAFRARPDGQAAERRLPPVALAAIGAVTGVGSALSGTGGPLILVPLLVFLKVPALAAVGLSQVIQVPISASASLGNYLYGSIDLAVALAIAAGLMLGVFAGARLAHLVAPALLQRLVAAVLVAVGLFIALRLGLEQIRV
ncbi:MAG: sulfite exporter TauE/SafE family protein [Kiloniellales bacterium]|nr:sulfite exporter TauE/SafE family protein [Kiloniellales bacterium]